MIKQFFSKDDVTILVTDSGLGGVSIAADMVEKLKTVKIFRKVRVVFFNSSFDNQSGYNKLKTNEEKIRIFNNALNSMQSNYRPDLILIGCNTLSVIYPETPFARSTTIPVIGIVETGVDFILEKLKNAPNAKIIIFATSTTITKGSHKKMLVQRGVKPENIIGISCADLADKIEDGHQSVETRDFVAHCVKEALSKLIDPDQPIIVSLNCTHYGYVLKFFEQEFEKNDIKPIAILNPNPRLAEFILQPEKFHRFKKTQVSIEVIAKVTIFPGVMKSIGELVATISPQTVQALQHYRRDENLF